jgi:4-amino-4-deoxychorismate lyase
MNARVFAGNTHVDTIAANDRGMAYGDGLFETMRACRGDVPWWSAHWRRLQAGAGRLRIPLPDEAQVRHEATQLLSGAEAILKLIVTRGAGGRGYAPPDDAMPTWIVSTHPLPPDTAGEGITVRWCDTRLAVQPLLAGIKHCNRLEQVLARAEWNDPAAQDRDAAEGLMRSAEGDVVSATAANLFVLRDDRWHTPPVDRCGVAGVCRAWALRELDAAESRLDVTAIEQADAIFLCNAVRGILPVAKLGRREWAPHPRVAAARERLAAGHPGFAP